MIIGVLHSACCNNVTVINSTFTSNKATYHGGGGTDTGFYLFNHAKPAQNNNITFYNCIFENNTAVYGGGSTLFSNQHTNRMSTNNVTFDNCSWLMNSARYSAAIDVSPNSYDNIVGGFPLTAIFTDCSFIQNYIDPHQVWHMGAVKFRFGSGTFLINAIDVVFNGVTNFTGNNGTALQVISSSAIFEQKSAVWYLPTTMDSKEEL